MSDEESEFVRKYFNDITYDDYDRQLMLQMLKVFVC